MGISVKQSLGDVLCPALSLLQCERAPLLATPFPTQAQTIAARIGTSALFDGVTRAAHHQYAAVQVKIVDPGGGHDLANPCRKTVLFRYHDGLPSSRWSNRVHAAPQYVNLPLAPVPPIAMLEPALHPPHMRAMNDRTTSSMPQWHGTTILSVRKNGRVVVGGDGQVSMGQTVMKPNARKVRRLHDGSVISGFAGATADAFTLFERLEAKLDRHSGQLMRAAVELAKDWRTDKYLRNLEAMMVVADKDITLIITGNGDVLEPVDGIAAIGSGGNFALSAARALIDYEDDAETIVRKAMAIAGDLCVYTNHNVTLEALESAA